MRQGNFVGTGPRPALPLSLASPLYFTNYKDGSISLFFAVLSEIKPPDDPRIAPALFRSHGERSRRETGSWADVQKLQ